MAHIKPKSVKEQLATIKKQKPAEKLMKATRTFTSIKKIAAKKAGARKGR